MKKTLTILACLFAVSAQSAQAAPYERYSQPRQCYGFFANSGERANINLTTQIVGRGLSKGDLIGTAFQFIGLPDGKKIKIAF
nr:hypothetical protein [Endozoicomonas sp.]